MKKSALILFAHGARDMRWAAPFQRLQKMTQEGLPDVQVELAFLEFMSPNLPELIDQLVEQGTNKVIVSPIFLGQGGHVLRDLPEMAVQINSKYPALDFSVATAVGEEVSVLNAIRDHCMALVA
ncbi:sirohydrochlorin chelatase [Undibacterium sp. SXout7W]|uniref:sirohydrochlorin chelatase n=1 Tax=Undibacterium sp. SXout7W TaxID=3413049 RepID=UPI003BF1E37B